MNDIAIIKLSKELAVKNMSNIQIACLPGDSIIYPSLNQTAFTVGWGIRSQDSTPSSVLVKSSKLKMIELDNCNKITNQNINSNPQDSYLNFYDNLHKNRPELSNSSEICANLDQSNSGSCNGKHKNSNFIIFKT